MGETDEYTDRQTDRQTNWDAIGTEANYTVVQKKRANFGGL